MSKKRQKMSKKRQKMSKKRRRNVEKTSKNVEKTNFDEIKTSKKTFNFFSFRKVNDYDINYEWRSTAESVISFLTSY
jgi:hypothetical protein